MKNRWMLLVIGSASCQLGTETQSDRVTLTEANDLGVVQIETARVERDGDRVFELRGFDANGIEQVSVQTRVGVIDELSDSPEVGSEIVFSMAGVQPERILTRETEVYHVQPPMQAKLAQFVALPTVSQLLAGQHLFVDPRLNDTSNDAAYAVEQCATSHVLSSPTATQCCWTQNWNGTGYNRYTLFIPASGPNVGRLIYRVGSPNYNWCKASDATSSCIGKACYYGPHGWARATITQGTGWITHNAGGSCGVNTTPPIEFGNVVGINGLACGCACDGSGRPCYDSSKPGNCGSEANCNTMGCPAGGGSGAGSWNY